MDVFGYMLAQNVPTKPEGTLKTNETNTYIPMPMPIQPAPNFNFFSAVLWITLILVLAFITRMLWRWPERAASHQIVKRWGGPFHIQNRLLRGLGYISFIVGLISGRFIEGVSTAALLMIAANVRPQGYGEQT